HARGDALLDTARWPQARYVGRLVDFVDGRPTRVDGELTLRGVTRPLALEVRSFKCMPHPMHRRELCGADALARFQRDDFGIDAGKHYGFDMTVTRRIQVEAVARECPGAATRLSPAPPRRRARAAGRARARCGSSPRRAETPRAPRRRGPACAAGRHAPPAAGGSRAARRPAPARPPAPGHRPGRRASTPPPRG